VFTQSNSTGSQLLECGGELIGRNHPTWLRFAREFNLGLSLITPDDDYIDLNAPMFANGQPLDSDEQEKLYHEMTSAYETLNHDAATVDANLPWLARRAGEWDAKTVADWINSLLN